MKDKGLEKLFSKSLKYYVDEGLILGQKYPDSGFVGSRRPSDFWMVTKDSIHHIECKQVTAKRFYFPFCRLYNTGQYNELYKFWRFSDITHSWLVLNFKRKSQDIDDYYIIHINDFKLIHEWIKKESLRISDLEYYYKFEFPKTNSLVYIDLTGKVNYKYDMRLNKISVDGVKGKILDLKSIIHNDNE